MEIVKQTTDKHINEELVSNHGEIIAPPKRYKKNTCKIETSRLKQLNEVVLTETKCLKKNNTNMDVIQEYTNCIQDEIERIFPERVDRRNFVMISNLKEKGDEQQLHELSDENHMRNGIDQNHDMEMKLVKRYETEIKALKKENHSLRKHCQNFDIISKRNENTWQKKEKFLLVNIETEKRNHLITLDNLNKMLRKEKGYETNTERKRLVKDENDVLINLEQMTDEMIKRTTAFDKTKRTIKYKMNDKQTMTNSDEISTKELNRYEIDIKVLKKENDLLRKNCKNFDIISNANEKTWQRKEKNLRNTIETEKKNCQIALDGLEMLQSKVNGHAKDLERKRKVMEENVLIAKENEYLKDKLNQARAEKKQLNVSLKEKLTDIQNMKYTNEHSIDESNAKVRSLRECLLESESRFSTLQDTYKIMMERLRRADNMVLEKEEENRELKDKENTIGRRKKNSRDQRTIDTQTTYKRLKERSDSKFRFGLYRDTFRIKMLKGESKRQRNSLTDKEERIKILQSVLENTEKRAITAEEDSKHKQTDIEFYERSQERLETEINEIKKSLENEQGKIKQLESSIHTTKQLKDEYMKLYSTFESIKKELEDSEKRLKGNSGFQTQELILMNRLKELIERIPVYRNYEFNVSPCSGQKTINSYNIQDSDVYISENSVIRQDSNPDQ